MTSYVGEYIGGWFLVLALIAMALIAGCATYPNGGFLVANSCNGDYVNKSCQFICYQSNEDCVNDCNGAAYYDSKMAKDNPNGEVFWVETNSN